MIEPYPKKVAGRGPSYVAEINQADLPQKAAICLKSLLAESTDPDSWHRYRLEVLKAYIQDLEDTIKEFNEELLRAEMEGELDD